MQVKHKKVITVENKSVVHDFLKSVLGDQIDIILQNNYSLGRGIKSSVYQVVTDSITNMPEGQSYFHFWPIADEEFYIMLTFFPEVSPKEEEEYVEVTRLVFEPIFFEQWDYNILIKKQPFKFDRSTEQAITMPPCCFEPISYLIPKKGQEADFETALQRKESAIFLLRTALNAFFNSNEANCLPACSFLSDSREREKVMEAYRVVMDNLSNPKTIRELARTVGMNECYLKKGFKVTFGKTIHQFQQHERIEKAKQLIKQGKYSINEVAFMMGFGSASHFSSAFKKISGMRPCELLG